MRVLLTIPARGLRQRLQPRLRALRDAVRTVGIPRREQAEGRRTLSGSGAARSCVSRGSGRPPGTIRSARARRACGQAGSRTPSTWRSRRTARTRSPARAARRRTTRSTSCSRTPLRLPGASGCTRAPRRHAAPLRLRLGPHVAGRDHPLLGDRYPRSEADTSCARTTGGECSRSGLDPDAGEAAQPDAGRPAVHDRHRPDPGRL